MTSPRLRLAGTVLSTRDARALASFYERLRADDQPQDGEVRVMLDPDGRPFCLFRSPNW